MFRHARDERLRSSAQRSNLWLFAAYFVVLLLLGGSSRPEAWSQPVVRLAAIAAGGAALLLAPPRSLRSAWPVIALLGALSALIALQLVPLPPAVWHHLPGRELLVLAERTAGLAPAWRPLTMTPDLTLNSLLATLPAWATALLIAATPDARLPDLVPILIAGLTGGALIGLVQAATGAPWLYWYAITNPGVATGLFANRNHDGLSLVLLLPLLAAWIALRTARMGSPGAPALAGAAIMAVLAIASILATGSRAALALTPVALALAGVVARRSVGGLVPRRWTSLAVVALAVIAAAALPLALGSEGVRRWGALRVADDGRIALLRPLLAMARAYLPWGTGVGSFATVFRIDEPLANLDLAWLNHAHDDLLEIGIEGGVPAWAIAAAMIGWIGARIVALWRGNRSAARNALGWLGAAWLLLMVAASFVDYPLRTPIGMSLFVLAMSLLDRSTSRIIQFGAKRMERH